MIREYQKGVKFKLSDNFDSTEFDCHCNNDDCDFTYIDDALIKYLQEKRSYLNLPIDITSGFRCSKHNKNVGGKKGSYHLTGKAADITVAEMTIPQILNIFSDAHGLGAYHTFVHVDLRGYRARWDERGK